MWELESKINDSEKMYFDKKNKNVTSEIVSPHCGSQYFSD